MNEAMASRRNGGYNGVSQGCRPNVYDAMVRMDLIWEAVKEESIMKCWRKANCMPLDDEDIEEGGNDNYENKDGGNDHDNGGDAGNGDYLNDENGDGDGGNDNGNGGDAANDRDAEDDDNDDLDENLAQLLEQLHHSIAQTDDADTQNEFAGTYIGHHSEERSAEEIVEAWNALDEEEINVSEDGTITECCERAALEALVQAETDHADKVVAEEFRARSRAEEAVEVEDNVGMEEIVESEGEQQSQSLGIEDEDSDEDADGVESYLEDASARELISIMQEKLDELADIVVYASNSEKFGAYCERAQRFLARLEHLTLVSDNTLTDLSAEVEQTEILNKKQSSLRSFFTPLPRQSNK